MWCRSSRGEREHCAIDDLFIVHRNFPKQVQTDKHVLGSPPSRVRGVDEEARGVIKEVMRRQRGGIKGSIHKYLKKSSITTSRKRTFSLYLAMDDISAKSELLEWSRHNKFGSLELQVGRFL